MKTFSKSLLTVLLLGFLLRLTACGFGLPNLYHADEPVVVNHAMAYGAGDLNPHFFKIPPLISYLLFGVYGLFYVLGHLAGAFKNLQAFEFLFYSDPSLFYLAARFIFGVLAGTLTIFMFYRLVARHFSPRAAILGAAFLAVNFLHVRDSHYIYADIPLLLVMISAFFVFFRTLERSAFKLDLGCGAMLGLAAAVKYNGAALLIPYGFILWKAGGVKKMVTSGLPAALAALGVFALLNPFAFLDFHFFQSELRQQALSNTGVPWLHHLRYSLTEAAGIPLLLFAFGGMVKIFSPFNVKKASFALFALAYYGVLVLAGQPYDRYVLPLIPFLIFFAADFIVGIQVPMR
ncbi:MAG TPA: glycosyltransferase family 39 protein, partial [bacterium]|nr:glycosyltransferase family 39 protein [bacterium]